MTIDQRPYLFYGVTQALCATCLRVVQAKEVIQDGKVWLLKRCAEHGPQRVLIADDAVYWRWARERFVKAPEQVAAYNTSHRWGCPYDCGICPEHEQHGCLSILEVTDACNLRCPTCYAASGPERQTHRSLAVIEGMLDRIVANEGGSPDIVQISGGEPTVHPEFWAILAACRRRPIRHLMLNTNGVRLANEADFAQRLADAGAAGFEVYLQFDSLAAGPLLALRGADLREVRRRALDALDRAGISTTLVVTVRSGLNDGELGDILRFARSRPCVRGVTIQPVQDSGRNDGFDPAIHRLTLTEVRRRILEQDDLWRPEDLVPVPCNPDALCMAYAIRQGGTWRPVSGLVDHQALIDGARATIAFEAEALRPEFIRAFSTALAPAGAAGAISRLLCCLPGVACGQLSYRDVFRVIIMQFLDRHSLDMRTVRRSCVHIAHPDGKRSIPFDTYNLFYRDRLEAEVLAPLRAAARA